MERCDFGAIHNPQCCRNERQQLPRICDRRFWWLVLQGSVSERIYEVASGGNDLIAHVAQSKHYVQMNWSDLNLMPAMPEIVMLRCWCYCCWRTLWGQWWQTLMDARRVGNGGGYGCKHCLPLLGNRAATPQFNGMYIVADGMTRPRQKMALYTWTSAPVCYAGPTNQVRGIFKGEFDNPSLLALSGMSAMWWARHAKPPISVWNSCRTSLYALIALSHDSGFAAEAALKHFVLARWHPARCLSLAFQRFTAQPDRLNLLTVLASSFQWRTKRTAVETGSRVYSTSLLMFQTRRGAVPDMGAWRITARPLLLLALVGTGPRKSPPPFSLSASSVTALSNRPPSLAPWWAGHSLQKPSLLASPTLPPSCRQNIGGVFPRPDWDYSNVYGLNHADDSTRKAVGFAAGSITTLQTRRHHTWLRFGVLIEIKVARPQIGQAVENITDLAGLNQQHVTERKYTCCCCVLHGRHSAVDGFYAKFGVIMALLNKAMFGCPYLPSWMSLIGAFHYLRVVKVSVFWRIRPRSIPPSAATMPQNSLMSTRCCWCCGALCRKPLSTAPALESNT